MLKYNDDYKKIEESKIDKLKKAQNLNAIEDKRVHLLLYFFGGHHSNLCDFIALKRLQRYVNVIPVISKADSFKSDELRRMKLDIMVEAFDRSVNFFDCLEGVRNVFGNVYNILTLLIRTLI